MDVDIRWIEYVEVGRASNGSHHDRWPHTLTRTHAGPGQPTATSRRDSEATTMKYGMHLRPVILIEVWGCCKCVLVMKMGGKVDDFR